MYNPLRLLGNRFKLRFGTLFGRILKMIERFMAHLSERYFIKEGELIGQTPIIVGLLVIAVFLGIFGTWGILAPIQSSAIAPGQLVLDFNKKTVQHLEGGIIQKIWVQEGQFVHKNEPLLTLQDISIRAEESLLKNQYIAARALQSRLGIELANKDRFSRSDLADLEDSEALTQSFKTQEFLFQSRRRDLQTRKHILDKQIRQLKSQISGLSIQKKSAQERLALLKYEGDIVEELLKTQNVSVMRQLEIEKQLAELQGVLGEIDSQIAVANQQILSTELEILQLDTTFRNEVLESLQQVDQQVSDLTERLKSAKDVLNRTIVRSPMSGLVMNIKYHTLGAVVQPGSEIMNIVPQDKEVVVEAKLKIEDIDSVHKGLLAKVQLSAYKSKKAPKIDGTVLSVSADSLTDEITGLPYYLTRVRLSQDQINRLNTQVKLYPGMPAQVFIMTGSRTLFGYLFSPIIDATYKAFRED